jgi:hypothetical protein
MSHGELPGKGRIRTPARPDRVRVCKITLASEPHRAPGLALVFRHW